MQHCSPFKHCTSQAVQFLVGRPITIFILDNITKDIYNVCTTYKDDWYNVLWSTIIRGWPVIMDYLLFWWWWFPNPNHNIAQLVRTVYGLSELDSNFGENMYITKSIPPQWKLWMSLKPCLEILKVFFQWWKLIWWSTKQKILRKTKLMTKYSIWDGV